MGIALLIIAVLAVLMQIDSKMDRGDDMSGYRPMSSHKANRGSVPTDLYDEEDWERVMTEHDD